MSETYPTVAKHTGLPGSVEDHKRLLEVVSTVPHKCPDANCPGNRNRRKLEAGEKLLATCKRLVSDTEKAAFEGQYGQCAPRDGERLAMLRAATAEYEAACAKGGAT